MAPITIKCEVIEANSVIGRCSAYAGAGTHDWLTVGQIWSCHSKTIDRIEHWRNKIIQNTYWKQVASSFHTSNCDDLLEKKNLRSLLLSTFESSNSRAQIQPNLIKAHWPVDAWYSCKPVPVPSFFTPWKINMEPKNDLPNLHDYVPC